MIVVGGNYGIWCNYDYYDDGDDENVDDDDAYDGDVSDGDDDDKDCYDNVGGNDFVDDCDSTYCNGHNERPATVVAVIQTDDGIRRSSVDGDGDHSYEL